MKNLKSFSKYFIIIIILGLIVYLFTGLIKDFTLESKKANTVNKNDITSTTTNNEQSTSTTNTTTTSTTTVIKPESSRKPSTTTSKVKPKSTTTNTSTSTKTTKKTTTTTTTTTKKITNTSTTTTTKVNNPTTKACTPKKFYISFRADFKTKDECIAIGNKYYENYYGYHCSWTEDDCGDTYYMLTLYKDGIDYFDYRDVPLP